MAKNSCCGCFGCCGGCLLGMVNLASLALGSCTACGVYVFAGKTKNTKSTQKIEQKYDSSKNVNHIKSSRSR